MANELLVPGLIIEADPISGVGFPALTRDPSTGLVCAGPPPLTGNLPSAFIFIGDSSGVATAQQVTGDITLSQIGVSSINTDVIYDAMVNSSASISRSKLAIGSSYRIVINNTNGVMTDAAAITASKLLVSDPNGIPTASAFDISIFDNVSTLSSPAQTQLNGKLSVTLTAPAQGDLLQYNGSAWVNFTVGTVGQVLTSDGTSAVWGSSVANGLTSGGTTHQYLRKIDNTNYNAEWHTLVLADVTDVSTTFTELNLLSGLTVTSAFLNFSDGLTGNIQDQLDNRILNTLSPGAILVGGPGGTPQQYAAGSDNYILTMVSGYPIWQAPPAPGTFTGPGASTDNAVVRFNGTSGASGQNSVVIISDTGTITGIENLTVNTGGAVRTATSAGNTLLVQAYDVDGAAYTTFITLTANNTPTMDLNTVATIGTAYIYRAGGTDVAVADGGTGISSYTIGDILYASGATTLSKLAASTAGYVLTSGGAGVAPTWSAVAGTGTVTNFIFTNGGGFTGVVATSTSTPTLSLTYDLSPNNTGQLTEGANLYFTNERVDDRVAALIQNGTGISWTYNDGANTLTGNVSITQYTDELAQDAVGNILTDTDTIDFTYVDGTPEINASVIDNSITNAKLAQMATHTIKGNNTGSTANASDLTISQVSTLLSDYNYVKTGNAFGGAAVLGLTDAFSLTVQTGNASLIFATNSVTRISITNAGVGSVTGAWSFSSSVTAATSLIAGTASVGTVITSTAVTWTGSSGTNPSFTRTSNGGTIFTGSGITVRIATVQISTSTADSDTSGATISGTGGALSFTGRVASSTMSTWTIGGGTQAFTTTNNWHNLAGTLGSTTTPGTGSFDAGYVFGATVNNSAGGTGGVVGFNFAPTNTDVTGVSIRAFQGVGGFTLAAGTANWSGVHLVPTFDTTAAFSGGTAIGFYFNPTLTHSVGLTVYGITIVPSTVFNGFGTAAPTAVVHVAGTFTATGNASLFNSIGSFGGGTGVAFIANASVSPTTNPTAGSILYAESGALKARGSSGTVTTLAAADPHCPECGSDFVVEYENDKYGYFTMCMSCLGKTHGDVPFVNRVKGKWNTHG